MITDIIDSLIDDLRAELSITFDHIESKILESQLRLLERLKDHLNAK